MAKTKQAKTTVKNVSVKEFKAWLSGILEFQPSDWVPSIDQWKTIQQKINNLQENIQIVETINNSTQSSMQTDPWAQQPRRLAQQPSAASLNDGHGTSLTLLPVGDAPPELIYSRC